MQIADSYAEFAGARTPKHLTGPVLRTRSVQARAVYAALAGGGRFTLEELTAADPVPAEVLDDPARRDWLAALAQVLASQLVLPEDAANALRLYAAIVAHSGAQALESQHQALYGQLLFREGEFERLRAVLPTLTDLPPLYAEYLRIDLANPFGAAGGDERAWLALASAPFTRTGIAGLRLLPDGSTPFDRLDAQPPAERTDGPLASVILSAFRPGHDLHTAVRSILRQTWRNLELIVVDDGSGAVYDSIFAEVAEVDERVSVLRQPVNGGSYQARNAGLDAARGEYVTFQDADDWSHPQRIELQVAALEADASRLATRSRAVRATDDLSHQWLGYPAQRINACSLLFRREPVLEQVGYFDSARKSADFEYAFRLEATSKGSVYDMDQPLYYTRLSTGSLSRSDFRPGWAAPARIAYQAGYRRWHQAIRSGASPYLPRTPEARPFPAPASYLRGVPGRPPRTHYDVLLVDDWVSHLDSVTGGVEQARILADRGFSVGLVHAETLVRASAKRRHIDPQAQAIVQDGTVDRVTLDEDRTASLVIVRDPLVLQFTQPEAATLRAESVVLCQPHEPTGYPGLSTAYVGDDCLEHARDLFDVVPTWEPALDIAPVDPARWALPRSSRSDRRPVAGTSFPDGPFWLPDERERVRKIYPAFGSVDVRLLAGPAIEKRLARFRQDGAYLVYRREQMPLRTFLYQLDFFLLFPDEQVSVPPLGVLTQAMAAGAVCVLPRRFEPVIGDAAVYCDEGEVAAVVKQVYSSEYLARVEAGRRFIRQHHCADAFAKDVERLMAAPR